MTNGVYMIEHWDGWQRKIIGYTLTLAEAERYVKNMDDKWMHTIIRIDKLSG